MASLMASMRAPDTHSELAPGVEGHYMLFMPSQSLATNSAHLGARNGLAGDAGDWAAIRQHTRVTEQTCAPEHGLAARHKATEQVSKSTASEQEHSRCARAQQMHKSSTSVPRSMPACISRNQ